MSLPEGVIVLDPQTPAGVVVSDELASAVVVGEVASAPDVVVLMPDVLADDVIFVAGPKGDRGPEGPRGPAGGDPGAVAHVHVQAAPASVWTVEHPLPFFPSVSVVDSAGTAVEGDVRYLDLDTVQITFSSGFSGTVYLS